MRPNVNLFRTGCPPKLSIQAKRAGVSDTTKRPIQFLKSYSPPESDVRNIRGGKKTHKR